MNSINWKKVLISGVVFAVLVVMLAVGVYLVRKPQSQSVSSKAAGCIMLWPADPGTSCGSSTQLPSQGASGVSLTPNFHWDYENCTLPSGCSVYSASVYLFEGSSNAAAMARCDTATATYSVKDCAFSSVKLCNGDSSCHTDGMPNLSALKPNTTYYWRVTPFFDGVVHAEQTWVYTFTTGSGTQTVGCNQTCNGTSLLCSSPYTCTAGKCVNPSCPTTQDSGCTCPIPAGSCQKVIASKDLSTIKIGDTVTFTGFGNLTNPPTGDSIDKINFIISKDGAEASNTEVATTLDSAGVWKATKDFPITSPGSYSVRIRTHWLSTDRWLE